MSGNTFYCYYCMGASGIWWVQASDVANPTMHRKRPTQQRMIPAQNVTGDELEKPRDSILSNEETKATEYLQHGTFNIKNYEQMIDRKGNCLVRLTENSEECRSSVCQLRQTPHQGRAHPWN